MNKTGIIIIKNEDSKLLNEDLCTTGADLSIDANTQKPNPPHPIQKVNFSAFHLFFDMLFSLSVVVDLLPTLFKKKSFTLFVGDESSKEFTHVHTHPCGTDVRISSIDEFGVCVCVCMCV